MSIIKKAQKKQKQVQRKKELKTLLGKPDENEFHILLAHTPRYAKEYFNWGADLTLSGHYHGGVLRLPFGGKGALSPDFVLFPKYCYGLFKKGEQKLIYGFRTWGTYNSNPNRQSEGTCGDFLQAKEKVDFLRKIM